MAIHQNRQVRGAGVAMKGYIKESLLPNCMDLVIWGHEHACEIEGGMYAVPESAEVRAPAHSLAALLGRAGESRLARTGRCSPAGVQEAPRIPPPRALASPCTSLAWHPPRLAPPRGAPRPSPPARRPPPRPHRPHHRRRAARARQVVPNPRAVRTCASQNQFTVIQPGSTVATSLVEGEAKPKHVALLSIKDDNWKMESIPLTTVRPFLLREVVLAEHADEYELHDEKALMEMLARQARRGRGPGGG